MALNTGLNSPLYPCLPTSDMLSFQGGGGYIFNYEPVFSAPVRDLVMHLQSFASVSPFRQRLAIAPVHIPPD